MKIRLDGEEIGILVRDWGKKKYNTHNVVLTWVHTSSGVEAELEIVLNEDQFTNTSRSVDSMMPDTEVSKALARFTQQTTERLLPELEPDLEGPPIGQSGILV